MNIPMVRIVLAFYPNQKNPARPSGRGVYRVVASYDVMFPEKGFAVTVPNGRAHLHMNADRHYKDGSRVDPKKIALTVARLYT